MEQSQQEQITKLWEKFKTYALLKVEIIKLGLVEKSAKLTADLLSTFLLGFFLVMVFLVASITFAFYLSALTGSYVTGFGCASVVFMLLALLVTWRKTLVEKIIAGIAIKRYFIRHCEHQDAPLNTSAMQNKKITFKGIWGVLKNAFDGFSDHKVTKLSGSLAYYTVFSMAPLLVVIISLCGIFLGQEAAQGQIYAQLGGFVGKDTALQLQDIVKKAAIGDKGMVAFIVGIATLLIGATTVFADIQDSINTIWGLKPKPKRGWLKMLQNRFLSFSVIISLAFLLLVSLGVTTVLDGFSQRLQARFADVSVILFYILNQLVTLVVVSLIFGVIFRVLPDAIIKWKDVLLGAVVTALLFMLGKFAISIYIGKSDIGSTYGAAGSLVILLLWTYYSSIILYFGAEFTKAYAIAYGEEIHPSPYAVTTKEVEIETGSKSVQANNAQ